MPIDDPTRIDGVGRKPETGEVTLVISDHLDWDDIPGHLSALEAKLNAYFEFIQSGQLASTHPFIEGTLAIDHVLKFAAPLSVEPILESLKAQIATQGVTYRSYMLRDSSEQ